MVNHNVPSWLLGRQGNMDAQVVTASEVPVCAAKYATKGEPRDTVRMSCSCYYLQARNVSTAEMANVLARATTVQGLAPDSTDV